MRSILSRIFGTRATTNRRGLPTKTRPQVEALESRWCPATMVSISNGVLTITGDERANAMLIRDSGNGTVVVFPSGQATQAFGNVDRIDVNTKGGKDVVEYEQSGDRTRSLALVVDLGGDVDRFAGTVGRILSGRALEIKVRGGGGRDFINTNAFGDVQANAFLRMDLNGGEHNDRVVGTYTNGKMDGELRLNVRGDGDDDDVTGVVAPAAGSVGHLGTAASGPSTVEGNSATDTLFFRVGNADSPGLQVFAKIDGGSNSFFRKDVGRHTANVFANGLERDILVT